MPHMKRLLVLLFGMAVLWIPAAAQSCPVTQAPATPLERPQGFPAASPGSFDVGTEELWVVALPRPWRGLSRNDRGYRQKIVWYSSRYNLDADTWREGPRPELTITGRRLDDNTPPVELGQGGLTYRDDMGSFIMSAVDVPTAGCWEITGRLGEQSTSFVVEVLP